MLRIGILSVVVAAFSLACANQKRETIRYIVAETPWETVINDASREKARPDRQPSAPNHLSLGNHRALIRVPATGDAALLDLEWRRHDRNVDKPRFIIINTKTQDTVKNIHRLDVNNEHCKIIFGPVAAGEYYFYYLPFEIQGGWGGYYRDYLPHEPLPDEEWVSSNNIKEGRYSDFIVARCIEIQSRTEFDSFYPMEVIATEEEKEKLISSNPDCKFLLFTEDRKYPVRMLDNIPQRWIINPANNEFKGAAEKNEYYVFQIGLYAIEDIKDVKLKFNPLQDKKYALPVSSMTCFNAGGIDPYGKPFDKTVNVAAGSVQPLWIGFDLPEDIPAGSYSTKLIIETGNAGQKVVEAEIKVSNKVMSDRGDGEAWRHSRLRWLNSKLGFDDNPVEPYKAIEIVDNKLILTGKEVTFAESGLPASINVYGEEVLAEQVQFIVNTIKGPIKFEPGMPKILKQEKNILSSEVSQKSEAINLATYSEIESDGWMKYYFDIEALKDIDISDIQLKIPFRKENSVYLSGMDLYGVNTPDNHDAKWDPLYDAFWLGSAKGGLYCELRGAAYSGPLLYYQPIRDFYKPFPPVSWNNNDKGGFRIRSNANERNAIAYSGSRTLKKGELLRFECAFIITPVKKLDTRHYFEQRYFHNQYQPEPDLDDAALGVKVANLHHANEFNPTINYPYAARKEMKGYVDRCHEKGIKVKIYYTTRELSNFSTEIWAFRSLGTEILTGGSSGGFPWLREHLVENYTPQWYQYLNDSRMADAAVLTSVGMTRFFNYYIEDLKWLTKNVGIDGLYIDAAAYDREIVKRMRKAMAEVKPGCLLDLHEGKNCILRYLEFFPYLDKTWIGEGIDYDKTEAVDYLVSISGIPMGMMSDMLHEGANPWRGIVFGITTRYGWTTNGIFCDPTNIWKVLDKFGIADSKMVGYWEEQPIVTTSDKSILATTYLKDKVMLISLASWGDKTTNVRLNIDFKRAGLDSDKIKIIAPPIKNFQTGKEFKLYETIPVEPARGWLLLVKEDL